MHRHTGGGGEEDPSRGHAPLSTRRRSVPSTSRRKRWIRRMFLIVVATSAAIGTGDSRVRASPAPTGEVIQGIFERSQIYPGTWREYWVYIPRQLDRTKPAPVMVFQDGIQYNAPAVFDDLIDKKEIPPLVGVFVMHGRVKAPSGEALDRMNRSVEYDSVNADYAKFLVDELLPY